MNNRILEIPDEAGGKSLVYYTRPGVESKNNGLNMIYNSLKNGRICVFIASTTTPSVIRNLLSVQDPVILKSNYA